MDISINLTDSALEVTSAMCGCAKGTAEACSHIGALLYGIAHLKRLGERVIPTDIVKTSLPQTWHIPRGEKIKGKAVQDLVCQGYNKRRNPMEAPKRQVTSTLYNPVRTDMPDMRDLHTAMLDIAPDAMVLPSLNVDASKVPTKFGSFPKGSVVAVHQRLDTDYCVNVYDGFEYPKLPVSNKIITNFNMFPLTYEKDLKLVGLECTIEQTHEYEELTRLQSQCQLWHQLKLDRLGASKMHGVKTRQKNFETLAVNLRKRTRSTKAMQDGLLNEPRAVECYVSVCGNAVNIYPVGIVINPWAFWLAASPDRKVYFPGRQNPVGILEIKCPSVTSVLECKYLQKIGNNLTLKKNHEYYTQIQMQLAITGLDWCDLFVWCEHDYHLETIEFNKDDWQLIKDKADRFFFEFFL